MIDTRHMAMCRVCYNKRILQGVRQKVRNIKKGGKKKKRKSTAIEKSGAKIAHLIMKERYEERMK